MPEVVPLSRRALLVGAGAAAAVATLPQVSALEPILPAEVVTLSSVYQTATDAELDKWAGDWGLTRWALPTIQQPLESDASLRQRLIDEIRKWCSRNSFILEGESCEKS
jgi:uncharacterized phage protein gp47/JayE